MAQGTPIVRRLLSYFVAQKMERVHSGISGDLEVILSEGRYMLNSPTATYSYEDKYTSFRQALSHIKSDLPDYTSALILGLGLGSVPLMLRSLFNFTGIITCVELDPEIIQLAGRYYPQQADFQNFIIHEADAVPWIQAGVERYDLIITDVFQDQSVPVALHSKEFLRALRNRVAPGGTLLFSRLSSQRKFEKRLWENLSEVFPDGEDIDTGGNVILRYKAKQ